MTTQLVGRRREEIEWHIVAICTVPVETVAAALELEGAEPVEWRAEHAELAVQRPHESGIGWVELDRIDT